MKLNIGAGYKHVEGFASVDIRPETKPDYVADLEQEGCLKAIRDDIVDEVVLSHTFEHISHIQGLMREIYRVCASGAIVRVICPYWSHRSSVEDPTHVRMMTERSMMYFSKNTIGSDGLPFVKDYNFKTVSITLIPDKNYQYLADDPQKLLEESKKYLNVVEQIVYVLEVIK